MGWLLRVLGVQDELCHGMAAHTALGLSASTQGCSCGWEPLEVLLRQG